MRSDRHRLRDASRAFDLTIAPSDVAFVCCIEGTGIELQALLLCESIRRFAGPYASAPIIAVNARPSRPIAADSARRLAELGVQYVCEPLNDTGSTYLTINRIVAGRWAEAHLDARYVVLLDSDMLFVRPPAFRHAGAGVRPVDTKGSASAGALDPMDSYWAAMCRLGGITVASLPFVTASIGGMPLRASYNGGFCIVRRELGILTETNRVFEASRALDMRPFRGRGISIEASTGSVGTEASEWWGSSQAALSVAIHTRTSDVRIYDERYNVPLHLIDPTDPGAPAWPATELVLLHYHGLLRTEHRARLLERLRLLGVDEQVWSWLGNELRAAA